MLEERAESIFYIDGWKCYRLPRTQPSDLLGVGEFLVMAESGEITVGGEGTVIGVAFPE